MEKIVSYISVSNMDQSPDDKKQAIIDYACRLNLVAKSNDIEFFIDLGCSPISLERPAITELSLLIKEGKIGSIIINSIKDISVREEHIMTFLNLLEEYKITLHCIENSYKQFFEDEQSNEGIYNKIANIIAEYDYDDES